MGDYVGGKASRSVSDGGSYLAAVKEAVASYRSFTTFKSDPRYTSILEHTTIEQGNDYLELIKLNSPEFLEKMTLFKENDIEGGARVCTYEEIGDVSPSTLRYIKVASDLKNLFGNHFEGNIAEIGVGYGGQLLINDKAFIFEEYHLFDLPPVLELTSKYLECHVLNKSYKNFTLNQHNGNVFYELAISNYSYSELPSSLQIKYAEKIFKKSKRGYLTMNSGLPNSAFSNNKLTITELKNILPKFDVIEEKPLTHPGNYIIVWGI